MYKSMGACFSNALHLLCYIHLKGDIERKCGELKKCHKLCIEEILGVKCDETKIKGLVDTTSADEFHQIYCKLREVWLKREGEKFVTYMDQHKMLELKNCYRGDIRTRSGL